VKGKERIIEKDLMDRMTTGPLPFNDFDLEWKIEQKRVKVRDRKPVCLTGNVYW